MTDEYKQVEKDLMDFLRERRELRRQYSRIMQKLEASAFAIEGLEDELNRIEVESETK